MQEFLARRCAFAALAMIGLLLTLGDALAANHTIRGHITSYRTGLPVAGAYIYVRSESSALGSVRTGADGGYSLLWSDEGASGSIGSIGVQTSDYAYESGTFDLTAEEVVKDFSLRGYGAIVGTMRHAGSGNPIPDSWVALYRFNGSSWVHESGHYSQSDGGFKFYQVVPDLYRVCGGGIEMQHARQCFNGIDIRIASDLDAATPIAVADDETVDGIDLRVTDGGTVKGTLWNKRTASPTGRTQILIELYDNTGNLLEDAYIYTSESGTYVLNGVPTGTFYIAISPLEGALRGKQLYAGIECPEDDCAPVSRGQSFTVSSGSTTSDIDFSFQPVATLEGVVTDRTSGAPLQGVRVSACVFPILFWSDCYGIASTPGNGRYAIDLDAEKYTLVAYASDSHADVLYPDLPCLTSFCNRRSDSVITLKKGDHLPNLDFALPRSSHISGTVRDASTGAPVAGATVAAFDADHKFLWSIWGTNESGTYTTVKWPAGTFYLAAYDSWARNCVFYVDRPCPPSASDPDAIAAIEPTPIVVADGETRTGIDIRIPSTDPVFSDGFDAVRP